MSKYKIWIIAAAVLALLFTCVAIKVFAGQTYYLTGNSCGTGLNGDTCTGGRISETYPEGTVVTLAPSPKTGYAFTGWRGDCSGKTLCTLVMTRNMFVMADFAKKPGKVRNLRIVDVRN